MLLLSRAVHVYVATEPCCLRKSFEGLANEVRQALAKDPLSGHVFVFLNRRKNMVKLLLWTRGGFTIFAKRLEQGTFTFPERVTSTAASVEIDVHELSMLLEGIDVARARSSRRWEPPAHVRGRAAMSEVLRAKVMHLDGTSLPVLDDKAPGNIKLGSIWGYVGVDGDVQRALCLYTSTGKAKGQREDEFGADGG